MYCQVGAGNGPEWRLPQAPSTCLAHMYQSLQPWPLSGGSRPSRVQAGRFTLLSRLPSTSPTPLLPQCHAVPGLACNIRRGRGRSLTFRAGKRAVLPAATPQHLGPMLCSPAWDYQELRLGNHLETGPLWCYQDHSATLQQGKRLVPMEYQARLQGAGPEASRVSSFPRTLFPTVPSPALTHS